MQPFKILNEQLSPIGEDALSSVHNDELTKTQKHVKILVSRSQTTNSEI